MLDEKHRRNDEGQLDSELLGLKHSAKEVGKFRGGGIGFTLCFAISQACQVYQGLSI